MAAGSQAQKSISLAGQNYQIIDSLERVAVVDSFVRENKIGQGSGESRLYIGSHNDSRISAFFNDWTLSAFFLKEDLEGYLADARTEYTNPTQNYNNKATMSAAWRKRYAEVSALSSGRQLFRIAEAPGIGDQRFYVRSHDPIYTLVRKIALPKISSFYIQKVSDSAGSLFYYFNINLKADHLPNSHPTIRKEVQRIRTDKTLTGYMKLQMLLSRVGQGRFRLYLLENMGSCPFTGISNKGLLIASHIKPWKDADKYEKVDPKNGLALTPTYDKLFDLGLISFEDDCSLLVSSTLTAAEKKILGLSAGTKYIFPASGREKYLGYHRKFIFIP